MRVISVSAVLALLFAVVGCGLVETVEDGSASLSVAAQELSSNDVKRVAITISGEHISPEIAYDLTLTNGRWTGVIGKIPSGSNRTFLAQAFDSAGIKLYE